jgi:hypothetical protein
LVRVKLTLTLCALPPCTSVIEVGLTLLMAMLVAGFTFWVSVGAVLPL